VTEQFVERARTWPLEVDDAGDSGALTLTRVIELPAELVAAEPLAPTAMATLCVELTLDDAYHRFLAMRDACEVVHEEIDAMFAALRDLQAVDPRQNTTAPLERLNRAWRRLDGEIQHLASVAPRCLDAICSVTADLYQELRRILAGIIPYQGGTPAQFRAEMDELAERLARHDRYATAREGQQP
jgi:hypothetical protein